MLVKDVARDTANSTRESYWGDVYPVNPEKIARSLGIMVYRDELPENTSGFIIKKKGQDPAIYLAANESDLRRNFTCAHEIGHYIERTQFQDVPDDDFGFVDLRDGTTNDIHEFFANEFAGNLLMPEAEVQRMHDSGFDEIRMAANFGVSVPAIKVRLRRLSLA